MPQYTRIDDHDIVQQDALIRALLEFYDTPHTLKEAQLALGYHPEDIRVNSTALKNAGFLTQSAVGWRYQTNNSGLAHLDRLRRLGHRHRYSDKTEIPT